MDKNSLKDSAQRVNTSIVFTDFHPVSDMKSQGQILRKGAVKIHSKAGRVARSDISRTYYVLLEYFE
jgi:hypothetical protein